MQNFDVVIVGSGPAGGQCGRTLANAGKKVLIVEKARDFSVNNYSSGGAPLNILSTYQLPNHIVSVFWNKISLYTSRGFHQWDSNSPQGVILDFRKLRQFLIDEAVNKSASLFLDCSYISHKQQNDKTIVCLKSHTSKEEIQVRTRVLVDATGSERNVLAKDSYCKKSAVAAAAIEYHIEVEKNAYAPYAGTLSFYMGHKWMPQGYSWVFPMQPNLLKIGVVRYFLHENIVPHEPSISRYLDQMVQQCLHSSSLPIEDKHGKTLYYTYRQNDCYYHRNIIAIGDAVSTLNPLAAEGIRHAMASADIASRHILNFLEKEWTFEAYPSEMKKHFGFKWRLSEMVMNTIYKEKDDHKIDLLLKAFKYFSMKELLDFGFSYKFGKAIKFYSLYKILSLFSGSHF